MSAAVDNGDGGRNGETSWADRRFLAVLGMPMFALSLSVTTVSAFTPLLLGEDEGPIVAGAVVATEGLFALLVPLVVAPWSDRLGGRLGRRLPFLLAGAPVAALGLVGIAVAQASLVLVAAGAMVFYIAYSAIVTPYMALHPDMVAPELRGRSQGSVGMWREVGLGLALVGGSLLAAIWSGLPFVFAAVVVVVAIGGFSLWAMRQRRGTDEEGGASGQDPRAITLGLLAENARLRNVLVANGLWETALSALRAFVLLFLTVGLGRGEEFASGVLAVVAVAAFVAAPLAGAIADRVGHGRVMLAALAIYAPGIAIPLATQELWLLFVLPVVAVAAVTVMTLAFSLLMHTLPESDHGVASGLFSMSRGVGLMLGPLLAGVAISLSEPLLPGTDGYAAIFGVAAVALLASIPFLRAATRG